MIKKIGVINVMTHQCVICVIKNYVRESKYGIGEEIVFPALTDLQKIKLEKPYYYLNVDGERLHLENVKFLKQQSLFQEACMEQLDFKPPTVKPKDWDMIINPLMKNHEPIDPPEGVTTHDQLQNHLEEFCLDRHIGSDIKDLKRGGVLTKDGYHHFIFDKFYNQFLIRKRWDVPYSRTAQMLKETCNCDDKRIGKERISVFVVKQFDKKTEDYTQKELKPKEINETLYMYSCVVSELMRTIVLGPPGTGKTTTLLNKVDDYLKQTDPDKVGYFAFTQKAAYEARDRAIKKFNLQKMIYHILEHYTH